MESKVETKYKDYGINVVYKIKNKINGKVYVGITSRSFKERMKSHRNSKSKDKFHNAIRKYGWNNFEPSIIETCDTYEQLLDREIFWIKECNSFKDGYNSSIGGERSPMLEKENRIKLSNTVKNKLDTQEKKDKLISRVHKHNKVNGHPMKDKKHSDYSKKKMRESALGRKNSKETKEKMSKNNSKSKKVLATKDNEVIEFNSLRKTALYFNTSHHVISEYIKKEKKIKGYTLAYKKVQRLS